MKTIVTFERWENNQGTGYFATVGMNNRYISHLKTSRGRRNEARNCYMAIPGRKVRVEDYYTGHIIEEFNI